MEHSNQQAMRVLITTRSFQKMKGKHWDVLRDAGLEPVSSGFDRALRAAELADLLPGVSAVITGMDEVNDIALEKADKLRVISMNGAGVDRIDVAAATRRGIVVTNTPGSNSESVADLTLALILAQVRGVPMHDRLVRTGGWQRKQGRELRGQLLGIAGLGRIGKAVATRAVAFGLQVQAYDPVIDHNYCEQNHIGNVDWITLVRTSDILSLHLPSTPSTRNIMNKEALSEMKPGAILINTSRGDLIDERGLIEVLQCGHLSGAGLDVYAAEPPLPSPLWHMDQVVLTPHLGSSTEEAALRTALQSAQNAVAVLFAEEPTNIVNPEVLRSASR